MPEPDSKHVPQVEEPERPRMGPLMKLFLMATVCVNLVFFFLAHESRESFDVLIGLMFGQLGVLAISMVRGSMHRLARAGWLVAITPALAALTAASMDGGPPRFQLLIALFSSYALAILVFTLLLDGVRSWLRARSAEQSEKKTWQIPLIEMFGWTIVVAIVSFGARSMNFEFLEYDDAVPLIVSLLGTPVVVALWCREDTKARKITKTILILIVWYSCASYFRISNREVFRSVLVQGGYLLCWLVVSSLDRKILIAMKDSGSAEKHRETDLQLYEPQE